MRRAAARRLPASRPGWMALLLLLVGAWHPGFAAQCPKLLMFDGINVKTQAGAEQAAYWGRTIGVQGVFVNNVMAYWQADVGTDPDSRLWQQAKLFQSNYAKYGVTDNFIKVALYKPHDWHSSEQNHAVVEHFAHAAALARYAGFAGLALDLEPYQPTWGGPQGGAGLAPTVEQEGREIGRAMFAAYPDMTLIVMPDVLDDSGKYKTLQQKLKSRLHRLKSGESGSPGYDRYELALPFLHGLLSVPWKHVVIGMEQTYSRNSEGITLSTPQARQRYAEFMAKTGAPEMQLSMAPGLWPLGRTSHDKSAREAPEKFAQRLAAASDVAKRYVWIYAKGNTWRAGGPQDAGPLAPDFQQFVNAIHQERASCMAAGASRRADSAPNGAGQR